MNVQVILVPYDSGHEGARAGRGPDYFLQRGLDRLLRDRGHEVSVCRIESSASFPTEIGTTFELNRLLAQQVSSAVNDDEFPLVLAGNCNSCVGNIAGVGPDQLGVIWLDAHGDFNTPETTVSGFLDGMGLAMATGRCWKSLLRTIPGHSPISDANIVHIGSRDLDPAEEEMFEQAGVTLITPGGAGVRQSIRAALLELKNRVDRVYLHVDMDVLDTGQAKANHLAVPGGLPVEVVEDAFRMTREFFKLCACGFTGFDPAYDKGDRVLQAGVRLMEAVVSED
jgi:arginase